MHPKDLLINEFDYDLPEDRIAKHPLGQRERSKLLIYRNGTIQEDIFLNLENHLPRGSYLVFNNTKVIEARLFFQKKGGTAVEIFCLEPEGNFIDPAMALLQNKTVRWKCLVGNARKWKEELLIKKIFIGRKQVDLTAKKIKRLRDVFVIEFNWYDDSINFAEIMHEAGIIPLPPYLHRLAEEADTKNYQTVYAEKIGSVAAPTAGLHFTKELLQRIQKKNKTSFITLHVGAGTFMPVKSATIHEHEMHAEYFEVSKKFIEQLANNADKNIVAVGTTTLRTLESLYWMGVKLIRFFEKENKRNVSAESICIRQWEPYELFDDISSTEAMQELLLWMNENKLTKLFAKTQIMLAPPYKLRIAKALITNFHQPRSTLLLLVAAITGDDWKKIYGYALANSFRFLSYGDGCLLFPKADIMPLPAREGFPM